MIASVGDAQPVQQHRDGVHQHRAVIGDDLKRGSEAAGFVGAVHGDLGLADRRAVRPTCACAASSAGDTLLAIDGRRPAAVIVESAAGASCGPW